MTLTPLARSLPASVPFVGPETLERRMGRPFRARLGANESVFGPSPLAVRAMAEAAAASWAYADPELHDVKAAIAAHHGLRPENIAVGEGIDGLLGLAVRLNVGAGDRVVTSRGAYPTLNYHVVGHAGVLDFVPYRGDDHEDLQALLDRAKETRPTLLYFANPDNPTGSWHSASDVERLMAETPEETLLLLDEAYADFAPAGTLPALQPLRPNVLRLRTFSKAHGMAGVRIGYAIGTPETVTEFDKVRNHFGVSRMAQAGAIAALADQAHLEATVRAVGEARTELARIAERAGLRALPSATNFVAIDCGRDGDFARRVLAGIIEEGVFIRMPGVAPLDRLIRVTAGRPEDLALFAEALDASLARA